MTLSLKENINKLHSDGMSVNDMSIKLNCGKSYIHRILRNKDVMTEREIKNKECIDLLKNTDMTFFMISRHLDMCENTIRKLAFDNKLREKKQSIW